MRGNPARRLRKPRGRYHHGDLRTALVETALAVVEAEGVDALTLRDLARRLGVSHAAPAHHFPDKAALLVALAAEGFARLSRLLEEAAGGQAPPRDRLLAFGRTYVRFALDHPAYFRVMFGPHVARLPRPSEAAVQAATGGYRVLERAVEELAGTGGTARAAHLELSTWSLLHGAATLYLDGALALQAPDLSARGAFEAWIEQALAALVDRIAPGPRPAGRGAGPRAG